jgi:hypothetical protein
MFFWIYTEIDMFFVRDFDEMLPVAFLFLDESLLET